MERVSNAKAVQFQKTMLKGGLAAAAPGLVAIVAAFTAPISLLNHFTGMGNMGVAALGVIFFGAAYFFKKGHWWAGIPAIFFTGWGVWVFTAKAARLLTLYYIHNPIITLNDIIAPFPVISLQLMLVFITLSLVLVIFKALKLTRFLSPQPINKYVWGAMGLWGVVIAMDCMNRFQSGG
ncbi:MAG: hypothetical protein L3J69_09900 [Desulfobacula sp.]|nr:hypothetical protein [Desulfobacula sp.]